MKRRCNLAWHATIADDRLAQKIAQEFAVVPNVQTSLHVLGAGNQVNWRGHGHGSRQIRRSLPAEFPEELEDQIGSHRESDQMEGGQTEGIAKLNEGAPPTVTPTFSGRPMRMLAR